MIYLVSNQKNAFDGIFNQISLTEALEKLSTLTNISNDTETEGLSCHTKQLLTIQLGNKYFQIVFDISSYQGQVPKELKDFMNEFEGTWILQNAKFDLQFYYKQGIILKHIYDTMLAEYIITLGLQEGGRDLKTIAKKYCNVDLDKSIRGEIVTKGLNSRVIQYAAYDVVYLEDIMEQQLKIIKAGKLQNALTLDNEAVKWLAYVEYCGIKLDWDKWKEQSLRNIDTMNQKKQQINQWLWDNNYKEYFDCFDLFTSDPHCIINWDSAQQVIPVFEKIGINCTVKIKGESKKTVEEKSLKNQIDKFPILKLFYDYKGIKKLTSTYGLSWENAINKNTHRIHTTYRQIMNTGRTSCGDSKLNYPNLQNLPNDKFTRSCFIAEPGNKLIAVDYCGQESIVLANFANDESLIDFYRKGLEDMHSYVAFLLFPELQTKPQEELTNEDLELIKKNHKQLRQIAKTAEFAINYGGNGDTIAKNVNCSKEQGKKVYENYFKVFSGLKKYYTKVMNNTRVKGFIEYNPITKRKFFIKPHSVFREYQVDGYNNYLPTDLQKEFNKEEAEIQRLSQNYPIQGSSSDISKLAGCYFFKEIINNSWFNVVKIVNFVHDEFVVECPENITEEVSQSLINCMKKAGSVFCKTIPLDADAAIGDYWIH